MQKRLFNECTAECNGLEKQGFYKIMRMHIGLFNQTHPMQHFFKFSNEILLEIFKIIGCQICYILNSIKVSLLYWVLSNTFRIEGKSVFWGFLVCQIYQNRQDLHHTGNALFVWKKTKAVAIKIEKLSNWDPSV